MIKLDNNTILNDQNKTENIGNIVYMYKCVSIHVYMYIYITSVSEIQENLKGIIADYRESPT